jgi:hypothetical protein
VAYAEARMSFICNRTRLWLRARIVTSDIAMVQGRRGEGENRGLARCSRGEARTGAVCGYHRPKKLKLNFSCLTRNVVDK